ncbi:DUF1761 domain-containing protein [Candidatus Gottesmanbacteria bacterium]|nr:DUF1761 domain-containing protein [Candidatus Gottesmanbacteria bacterium]
MFLVPINYVAILLCGVAAMVVGFVWYGPLFGKEWMGLVGMTKEKMEKAKADMTKTYGLSFLSSLIMAYALAHFVWFTAPGSVDLTVGVKTALWAWVGFVATTAVSGYLYSPEKKPMKLFVIDTGYYLATLLVMGVILALMPWG